MAISPSPFDRVKKSRRADPRHWRWWVLLRVLVVGLAIVFRAQAASMFWQVVAPLAQLRTSLGATEVERLRAELAQTQARALDRDTLYKENVDLRARLGRTDAPVSRIVATVLQRSPWTPYDTLVIDAGEAQGAALGDLVSAGGAALIGRVIEVYSNTSRVELFSTPGAAYQATLNGTLPVAVEGQGGGSMQALVPAGTQVAVGDQIVIPGLAGGISATVSAVDARAGESFIVVYMRLPVNPADLHMVELIKP